MQARCVSETVIVRWAHAARQFVSIKFSFHPYNIYCDCPYWLNHRITRKLLNIDRYYAPRGLASIELSFRPCNSRRVVSRGNKNVGYGTWKRRFLALAVRITRKLLQIDGYMLQGVWQALNCLSIHATHCVIIAGASPGETKMWAAVREHDAFLHLRGYAKQANLGVSWLISTTVLLRVYQSTITNRKHAKRIQRWLWPL